VGNVIKIPYQNVNVNKFHQELINLGITPDAVLPISESTCKIRFNDIFEYELKDEEGNITGCKYKERIEVIVDKGLETEHTETKDIDFDYGKFIADIQVVVDAHDQLSIIKSEQIRLIKDSCNQAIYDGFEYEGHWYTYDLKDQSRFGLIKSDIDDLPPDSVVGWGVKDQEEEIVHDIESFKALYRHALYVHMKLMIDRSRELEDQIKASNSLDEIRSIVW